MSIQYTYSVKQLCRQLKQLLESDFGDIALEGEITQLTRAASGHIYFSIKEDNSIIRCAFFKGRHQGMKTRPEEGRKVILHGRVSLYEPRGDLQFIVNSIQDAGVGDLSQQFEKLKQQLLAEGLFEKQHKKPIPTHPRRIGVITSASGSVIRDILTTLERRYPLAEVIVYPCSVQGQTAISEITQMLALANQRQEVDVLIVARGGGSLEDLQAFNDESVARAIFASALPLISAVGHETDFTIADMVADLRAPTPTAAAEICAPDIRQIIQQLSKQQRSLQLAWRRYYETQQQNVDLKTSQLRDPAQRLKNAQDKAMHLQMRLTKEINHNLVTANQQLQYRRQQLTRLAPDRLLQQNIDALKKQHLVLLRCAASILQEKQTHLDNLQQKLSILGPEQTLSRGYSILTNEKKQIINQVKQANQAQSISARLSDGEVMLLRKKQ